MKEVVKNTVVEFFSQRIKHNNLKEVHFTSIGTGLDF